MLFLHELNNMYSDNSLTDFEKEDAIGHLSWCSDLWTERRKVSLYVMQLLIVNTLWLLKLNHVVLFKPWHLECVHIGTVQSKNCLYFTLGVDSISDLPLAPHLSLPHDFSDCPCSLQKCVRSVRDGLLGFDVSFSIDR